jgi:hypothetical protein
MDFADMATAGLLGPWGGEYAQGSAADVLSGDLAGSSVQDLFKALEAGHDTAAGGTDPSGYALRPESLEEAFKLQTYREEHARLWKRIPKDRAFSTVEEYNRLNSYGDVAVNPFANEGELPPAEDSSWTRHLELMKFMGSTRVVSDVLATVRTAHGDPVAREIQNGFNWILRQINWALYFADETTNPTEFNGLYKQIVDGTSSAHLVDVRNTTTGLGDHLTDAIIDDASERVFGLQAFGQLSHLFYSTKAHKNFARQILGAASANVRFEPGPNAGGAVDAGFSMRRYTSQFSRMNLEPDVFLNPVGYAEATLTGSFARGDATLRPATPSFAAPVITPANGGQWGTAVGNYRYTMVAINEFGNSAAPASQVAAVATAADSVTLSITWGGGAGDPTGFAIYRTEPGDTTLYEITRVAAGVATPTVFIDRNENIANTSKAVGFTMDQNVVQFKQLLPMTKVPLAKIDLRQRFALILWGAPLLYSPFKAIAFRNISNVPL